MYISETDDVKANTAILALTSSVSVIYITEVMV
jgi:hypothetical protein